jgi:hypothetical protein
MCVCVCVCVCVCACACVRIYIHMYTYTTLRIHLFNVICCFDKLVQDVVLIQNSLAFFNEMKSKKKDPISFLLVVGLFFDTFGVSQRSILAQRDLPDKNQTLLTIILVKSSVSFDEVCSCLCCLKSDCTLENIANIFAGACIPHGEKRMHLMHDVYRFQRPSMVSRSPQKARMLPP